MSAVSSSKPITAQDGAQDAHCSYELWVIAIAEHLLQFPMAIFLGVVGSPTGKASRYSADNAISLDNPWAEM